MSDEARLARQIALLALDLAERAGANQRSVAALRSTLARVTQLGYTTVNEPLHQTARVRRKLTS